MSYTYQYLFGHLNFLLVIFGFLTVFLKKILEIILETAYFSRNVKLVSLMIPHIFTRVTEAHLE